MDQMMSVDAPKFTGGLPDGNSKRLHEIEFLLESLKEILEKENQLLKSASVEFTDSTSRDKLQLIMLFNRMSIEDEALEIGYPGTNPDPALRSDDQPNNRVLIDWSPTSGYTTAPQKPSLRRGSYIYDPVNGLWYRVRDVEEVTPSDLVNRPTTNPDTAAIARPCTLDVLP